MAEQSSQPCDSQLKDQQTPIVTITPPNGPFQIGSNSLKPLVVNTQNLESARVSLDSTPNVTFLRLSQQQESFQQQISQLSPVRRSVNSNTNSNANSPLKKLRPTSLSFNQQKLQEFFIAHSQQVTLESFPLIVDLHEEMMKVLDQLSGKIDTMLCHYEADLVLGYRCFISKIKSELNELRVQAESKQGTSLQQLELSQQQIIQTQQQKQIISLQQELSDVYAHLATQKQVLAEKDRLLKQFQKDIDHLEKQLKQTKSHSLQTHCESYYSLLNSSTSNGKNSVQTPQKTPCQSPKTSRVFQPVPSIGGFSPHSIRQILVQSPGNNSNNKQQNSNITSSSASRNCLPSNEVSSPITKKNENITNNNNQSNNEISQEDEQILMNQNLLYAKPVIKLMRSTSNYPQLASHFIQLCQTISDQKNKQLKQLKSKLDRTVEEKLKVCMARSDLESFFVNCIESARKIDAEKRNRIYKSSVPSSPHNRFISSNENSSQAERIHEKYPDNTQKDFSTFRGEDKLVILKLLLENDDILQLLHKRLFPSFYVHSQGYPQVDSNNKPIRAQQIPSQNASSFYDQDQSASNESDQQKNMKRLLLPNITKNEEQRKEYNIESSLIHRKRVSKSVIQRDIAKRNSMESYSLEKNKTGAGLVWKPEDIIDQGRVIVQRKRANSSFKIEL